MAKIYARLIISGNKTFLDVQEKDCAAVAAALIELGRPDLIIKEVEGTEEAKETE